MANKSKSVGAKKIAKKRVAVVGLWHLGSVYATSLAKMGSSVTGFDFNKKVTANFNKGIPPIFEPGLETLLTEQKKSLSFSSSTESLSNKDYIFITHDLVVDENDIGDTAIMEKIFKTVGKYVTKNTIVVISSQIPVGTSRMLVTMLVKKGIRDPKVIYFPENLRLGTAYDSFLTPDRIILGSDNQEALEQFQKDFNFQCPVITMGLESAEMVKHALNVYLATCVSLSSELSDIAEGVGANMNDVVKALKSDKRVSPFAPINPGLGFAGGTLGRDIQSLRTVSKKLKYTPKLLEAVYKVNQDRLPHLLSKLEALYPVLAGKKIGILGLTYKPNTNTLRRSMSLGIAKLLSKKKAVIKAFDPAVTEGVEGAPYIKVCSSVQEFAKDLDGIVLMTDWKVFLEIDSKELATLVKHKVVVDTKNFLPADAYRKHGFKYIGIGI